MALEKLFSHPRRNGSRVVGTRAGLKAVASTYILTPSSNSRLGRNPFKVKMLGSIPAGVAKEHLEQKSKKIFIRNGACTKSKFLVRWRNR